MRKPNCTSNFCRKKALRKKFCASLAQALFHTASVISGNWRAPYSCPLFPQQETFFEGAGYLSFGPGTDMRLFDYLVGYNESG
jgi:hypothetical protein